MSHFYQEQDSESSDNYQVAEADRADVKLDFEQNMFSMQQQEAPTTQQQESRFPPIHAGRNQRYDPPD